MKANLVFFMLVLIGSLFYIYFASKAQMSGWLQSLKKFFEEEVRRHGKKEEGK